MKKISNKFHQWALYPFSKIQLVVYYQWCIRWLVELLLGYMLYRKIPKISPEAYIFQRPFLRGLFLEGLIFGGAYLRREICVSKSIGLPYFWKKIYRFCFVLLCIWGQFQSTRPPGGGAYTWRGDLTEGFLRYEFGVLHLEGLIHTEGLTFGILR